MKNYIRRIATLSGLSCCFFVSMPFYEKILRLYPGNLVNCKFFGRNNVDLGFVNKQRKY